MKKKILNLLFLSSALLLAACNDDAETPTDSVPSEPAQSDSLPDSTPSEPSETTPSDTAPSDSTPENPDAPEQVKVTLNRTIYLAGEELDVAKVEVWSNSFGCYTEKLNYIVEMPTEVTNGNASAKVTVGRFFADVPIKYYETAELAAQDNPITLPDDAESYFDESAYINVENQKLLFSTTEVDGELYTVGSSASVNKKNEDTLNPTFNSNILDVFFVPETGAEKDVTASVYDATKYTIPHYVVDEPVLDADGNPVLNEDGTAQVIAKDHYNITYFPTYNTTDTTVIYSQHYMYEIILDGDGHVAYMGAIDWTNPIDISKNDAPYWSIYKDYTTNPCFAFAEDYDAESNPFAYQKVLPEGGYWLVGTVNEPNRPGKIDAIFKQITGLDSTLYASKASIKLTWDDIEVENKLTESVVKYEKISRNVYGMNAYTAADVYETYAYYYQLALASGDADKIALRDTIYNALIYLKLPEVRSEKVLYDYYQEQCSSKLAEWAAMFA